MDIKKQFEYNPGVEVSAAQIGISKWNWTSIFTSDEEKAKEIMKSQRFDVLPITNEDGSVNSYYSTQEWSVYDSLNKDRIKNAQTIYYRLSLRDLIKKFNTDDQHFYFLTDYSQILGLVSLVNVNCQLVYNYLFFVLADIERSVSQVLKEHVSEEDILKCCDNSTDKHMKDLAIDFRKNILDNNDNEIFQHMYLQTLGVILKKFLNRLPEEYRKLGKYSSKFGSKSIYNLIRNKVMHPVRPILSDKKSISQLDELLTDYLAIKDIID